MLSGTSITTSRSSGMPTLRNASRKYSSVVQVLPSGISTTAFLRTVSLHSARMQSGVSFFFISLHRALVGLGLVVLVFRAHI